MATKTPSKTNTGFRTIMLLNDSSGIALQQLANYLCGANGFNPELFASGDTIQVASAPASAFAAPSAAAGDVTVTLADPDLTGGLFGTGDGQQVTVFAQVVGNTHKVRVNPATVCPDQPAAPFTHVDMTAGLSSVTFVWNADTANGGTGKGWILINASGTVALS